MTEHRENQRPAAEQPDRQQSVQPHTFALAVVGGWVVLELLVRWGGVLSLQSIVGSTAATDWILLLVGFPLMALLLSVAALRYGQSPADWGYEWSARAVGAGVVAIAVAVLLTTVTGEIDAFLFGLEDAGAAFGATVTETIRATPLLAAVLLLGNGVAVPIAEEQVWRGIVQTELVASWGARIGILATAALFALKHVIVDLAVFRVTTLVALGLLLGVVRHRYGTGSSVALHIGVNLLSSAGLVLAAFS